MGQRQQKPTTPGRRSATIPEFAGLKKSSKPRRALVHGAIVGTGGRGGDGRTASRFRGGGHKRRFRSIDFRRIKDGVPGRVVGLEYDPNRSADIALLSYLDGAFAYILAPAGVKEGDVLTSGTGSEIRPGNCLPLSEIPLGVVIHGIELRPGKGAQMVRSAGTGAQLMAREGKYALVRLPSGEVRRVLATCRASIGKVGNEEHGNRSLGKAGRARWLGRRPHQRGVTMNPVDHPHGGGEGRTSGGGHPRTPWGKPTRGYKTRKRKNPYVVSARRSKRKRS